MHPCLPIHKSVRAIECSTGARIQGHLCPAPQVQRVQIHAVNGPGEGRRQKEPPGCKSASLADECAFIPRKAALGTEPSAISTVAGGKWEPNLAPIPEQLRDLLECPGSDSRVVGMFRVPGSAIWQRH